MLLDSHLAVVKLLRSRSDCLIEGCEQLAVLRDFVSFGPGFCYSL